MSEGKEQKQDTILINQSDKNDADKEEKQDKGDEREGILKDNLDEYNGGAEDAFKDKKYNTAVTLFFKAMCAAVDCFIFKKEGYIPSSHTDRFRIVKQKYREVYTLIDKDFPFYQDSYTRRMDKEAAEVLKEDVGKIKKMFEEVSKK